MMDRELIILIAGLIAWIGLSIYASVRAKRYFTVSKKRLKLNLIMIWVIPLFWALLIILIASKVKDRKSDGYKYHEAGYSKYSKFGE
jgi:hypothetical protein